MVSIALNEQEAQLALTDFNDIWGKNIQTS
jgi:hypothetical protein